MTIALLVALLALVGAFAWLIDRKDKRHDCIIADLCQRIQAPEVAVHQHAAEASPADEPFPLSDEEAQEEMETRRAIQRLEDIANNEAPWLS